MQTHQDKIRIGVIGAGGAAKYLHLPILVNLPDIEVSWICDKEKNKAKSLSKLFKIPGVYTDINKCGDVDIVLLAIPVGFRSEVMPVIFQRQWHVLCEKPFALTIKETDTYLNEARKSNIQIGVGLVRRYAPATSMARKIIQEQDFGPILKVWASEGKRMKRTGKDAGWYVGNPENVGGGVLMETGTHLVDQLCTIIDAKKLKLDKCTQKKHGGLEFETQFIGTVYTKHQKNIRCLFEVSFLEDLCNGIFVQFKDYILKCGLSFDSPLELLTIDGKVIAMFNVSTGAKSLEQALYSEWRDFIDQCNTGMKSGISADTNRQSIDIIEQCYKKADELSV